jgi:hypothetical protein
VNSITFARGGAELPYAVVRWELRNLLEKFVWAYGEGVGQLYNIDDADVTFSSFHTPNIVPMQMCQFGEAFLRNAAPDSELPNPFPYQRSWISRRHLDIIVA